MSRDTPPPASAPPSSTPPWCRPSALARRTGMSVRSIERYCRDGVIAGATRSPGGHWRIPGDSAEAFVTLMRANAA